MDESNINKHISQNDIPVLVDFWAPCCGPCKAMAPAFKQASALLEPKIRLAKLNTEKEQAVVYQFRIQSIPTIALFKNGREVARQPDAMGACQTCEMGTGTSSVEPDNTKLPSGVASQAIPIILQKFLN